MAKSKGKSAAATLFACKECGDTGSKWAGRCLSCGAWDSLVEVPQATADALEGRTTPTGWARTPSIPLPLSEVEVQARDRLSTSMGELDRVLGGGLVPGSLVLIGGDPGIGKSTLLLQMTAAFSAADLRVLYATGEESLAQVKLRAKRLELPGAKTLVLAETDLDAVIAHARRSGAQVLVVDSIQTMFLARANGSPGSPAQLRECTLSLMEMAKQSGCAVFLVGHVTKEGQLAGPRMLEHMVDTVVYFEGDRHQSFRILRAVKNRFGATHEIGVFEMAAQGLLPVTNPSRLFLGGDRERDPGAVATCSLEGTRPLLVEVQALVARTNYSVPQRVSMGFDGKRLTVLLALLDRFAGVEIGVQDVFMSVAGGFRLDEPAVDLAVAAAVAGSHLGRRVPAGAVALGELGLNGELRPVPQLALRLREAERLGLTEAVIPAQVAESLPKLKMAVHRARNLAEALEKLGLR